MKAVLDTNVWLDCLVFADPGVETLHDCIRTGRLVVLVALQAGGTQSL